MTRMLKLLGSASMLPVAIMGINPAFAAGTTQGTSITNTVQVNFTVGGVGQTPVNSNTDAFTVDRKLIFTVAEQTPTGTTTIAPSQQDAIVTYTLTNATNDVVDFALSASNMAGGAAPRGTDNIDASNLEICVDADNNGTCSGTGAETWGATGTVDDLAADGIRRIFVRGDFAAGVTNGQIAGVRLAATAHVGGSAGLGAVYSTAGVGAALVLNDTNANTAGVDTIFADVAGTNDSSVARDGIVNTLDDYTVGAAALSVYKSSRIISDPVSSSNPKAIPGAVMEYCISVTNAASAALAQGISIADVMPANTTYLPGSILVDGTVTSPGVSQTCAAGTAKTDIVDTPTDDGGNYNGGTLTVNGTLSDIAASTSRALIFRVTIN